MENVTRDKEINMGRSTFLLFSFVVLATFSLSSGCPFFSLGNAVALLLALGCLAFIKLQVLPIQALEEQKLTQQPLHSLDEIYRWLFTHGDRAMVRKISGVACEIPSESLDWALAAAEKSCRERKIIPNFTLSVSGSRGIREHLAMFQFWLFERSRLHLAAAAIYLSGLAFATQDKISPRQSEILARAITEAFS
jgi:hypothetical protein